MHISGLIKQCILTVVPEVNELINSNIPAYALIKEGKREEQIMIAVLQSHRTISSPDNNGEIRKGTKRLQ